MLYRRAQAQRVLSVKEARLVGTGPSLWVRLLEPELLAGAKVLEPSPPRKSVELISQQPKTAEATP
jgi:hypothetical protein